MRKRLFSVILAALVGLGTSACGAGQESGEPFDVLRLVSCEGASVRFAAAGGEDDVALSGILAESDVPYAGAFNSIFTGDLEITFGFQEDEPVSYRRFTFAFASAVQPEKSFSVVYEASWTDPAQATGQSGVYVRCGSEVRTTRYWQTADREEAWQSNADLDVGNALASPMFSGFGFGEQYGRLSLSWGSDGVLEVSVTEYSDPDGRSPRVIAAFDGSTATEWELTEQLVAEVEEEKSADLSMYYMIGNHDFYQCYTDGGRPGLTFAEAMEPYRELMGITDEDPNVTYYSRQVNGVYHIVLGTEERDGNWVDARISDTQLAWLEEQLEIAEAADPDMPVFVYLHQPMTDTTAGTLPGQGWDHVRTWDEQTQSWVNDVQPIRDILAAHPQAFFINGHNHRDLNNTYRIAYFASSELPNNIVQTGGTAYLSDTWGSSEGHQGWYVYVYGSEVLFLGREFTTGKWLPGACLLFSV